MDADSTNISHTQFVESVGYLLRETFEGSPEGQPSAFLDRGVGLISTLGEVTAETASIDFDGTTLAAQTEHAKFYLDRLCEYINGRTEPVNWDDSWLIETVSPDEWTALQFTLNESYKRTMLCLAASRPWTQVQLGMAMGMVAHSAYHLGAIRQIIKAVKQ